MMTTLRWFGGGMCAVLLTLILSTNLHAQRPDGRGSGGGRSGVSGTVSGTITDDKSGESIPGATIALWRVSDSSLVTGGVSKADGTFTIEGLPAGEYYAKISSLGYQDQQVNSLVVRPGGTTVKVGTIRLQVDESLESEGVTLTSERPDIEFKADRTVYNVENQPVNAGGDAMDVLKNVPQIEVDIDDNISLRGSQNVVVLLNGRSVPMSGEALAGFLRGLSASEIKNIEIIPNPSAKYDPDGMAGILNIVLKNEKKEGSLSGNVTLSAGTTNSYNASGSLNWRSNKFNLYNSYSFRYDERESERDLYRENRVAEPLTILDQQSEGERIRRSHSLNSTFEYLLNDVSTLSLTSFLSLRSGNDADRVDYTELNSQREITSQTIRLSPEVEHEGSVDLALGYSWKKEPGRHEFSAEARYNTNKDEENSDYFEYLLLNQDSVVERQNSLSNDRNQEGSFQVDYIRPLGEKGRLEAGYKGELNRVDNDFYSETFNQIVGEFQPDLDLNNQFVYDQQLHSLYLIYANTFGSIETQIGLRAEQAMTDFNLVTTDESFENNYFSLFPSAAFSYSLTDKTRLRASYSQRVHRPWVRQLNPFPQFQDRLNVRTGNPYLLPEYIHSVELGLNQYTNWGTLSLTPYFRRTTNQIEHYYSLDSSGISTFTFENFDESDSYGAEFVGTYKAGKVFTGFLNLSAYRIVTDASNVESDLSNDAFSWSGRVNGTLTLFSNLDIQLSYFYRAPLDIADGRINAMHGADLAVKKSFLDDRASLSLRVSDLFNTRGFSLQRDGKDYYIEMENRRDTRTGWLSFSWNFGQDDKRRNRNQQGEREGGSNGPTTIDFGD